MYVSIKYLSKREKEGKDKGGRKVRERGREGGREREDLF
jgi:hypothetical protein